MIFLEYIRRVNGAMAINTATYGIPHNCKNWLALASVVWGDLDISEAIHIVTDRGKGLPTKRSIQDEFALTDKVIELCKQGMTNRQIMSALNITSNKVNRAKNWGEWNSVSKTCE
jgi:hypothetical protein